MTKNQLKPFIPPRMLEQQGETLSAVYLHFVDGLPDKEAADLALISRTTANIAIKKVRDAMEAAGWTREYVRRVIYHPPRKAKARK